MQISIPTPREFNFKRTVASHGWYGLLPFRLDRAKWLLTRTLDLQESKPVTVTIGATKRALQLNTSRRLSQAATGQVVRDVRHMLRLDDNIEEFYRMVVADREFNWIPAQGAGRLLRSPTVFEDLVKMICTTNCSWHCKVQYGTVQYNIVQYGTVQCSTSKLSAVECSAAQYSTVQRSSSRANSAEPLPSRVLNRAQTRLTKHTASTLHGERNT